MLPRMSVMISFCCTEPPKFWDTAVEPGVEVLSCKMVKRINYTPLPFVLGPILAVVFPLRWKSHNIKLAILKCTIQWHLEHFQCHAVHLHQVPHCFQNPKGKCRAYKAVTPPFPLPSSSWKPPICLLLLWICLFWTFPSNGIIQYGVFCLWLPGLSMMCSTFICVVYISTSFLSVAE